MRFLFDNQRRFSRIGFVSGYYAAQSAWTKCSDNLPAENRAVLVFADGSFGVSHFPADGFWDIGAKVTHWMELPDQPAQEEPIVAVVEPEVEPEVEPVVEPEVEPEVEPVVSDDNS